MLGRVELERERGAKASVDPLACRDDDQEMRADGGQERLEEPAREREEALEGIEDQHVRSVAASEVFEALAALRGEHFEDVVRVRCGVFTADPEDRSAFRLDIVAEAARDGALSDAGRTKERDELRALRAFAIRTLERRELGAAPDEALAPAVRHRLAHPHCRHRARLATPRRNGCERTRPVCRSTKKRSALG